jgi:hypothetical protein
MWHLPPTLPIRHHLQQPILVIQHIPEADRVVLGLVPNLSAFQDKATPVENPSLTQINKDSHKLPYIEYQPPMEDIFEVRRFNEFIGREHGIK